jgi:hypothetical protein
MSLPSPNARGQYSSAVVGGARRALRRTRNFPQNFAQPRESEGYIPINFVKDLRGHIAAKRRSDFGGTPPPGIARILRMLTRRHE